MYTYIYLAQTAEQDINPPGDIPLQSSALHTHSHQHTPCTVFSYAQLLMDKQRAVNYDGLSADIFPSHILEA